MSASKLSKRLMQLHCYGKTGNNVPHFSDFLHFVFVLFCFDYGLTSR